MLALNEGKLLTHRTLLQEVWGPGYDGASNLLHVNVSQLRRKIEPDRARPRYLLTEPGAGYRLGRPGEAPDSSGPGQRATLSVRRQAAVVAVEAWLDAASCERVRQPAPAARRGRQIRVVETG